jgi:ketol-acid reductoisomerase
LTSLLDALASALACRFMAARNYFDRNVALRSLKGQKCAVIGFGAQGRAQALNLRDSGLDVVVGLYATSKSRAAARRCGFKVRNTAEAVQCADIIFLALPDTKMPEVFNKDVAPHLRPGQTLLFAHGFAIHYRTIKPRKDIDIVMVAPKGLGPMVRREFVKGRGVPGLLAVHQDASGHAKKTALAWAKAIGCTRAGVIETTFRAETETDLFGEQAVLCGGVTALVRNAYETLVGAGYAPELAYFECLHELKFIVDLMHEQGVAGMRSLISETAKWGELTVGPQIIDAHVRANMRKALGKIHDGTFARQFIREMEGGRKRYTALLRAAQKHPMENVGKKLRARMRWKKKNKN